MFTETLFGNTKKALALLAESELLADAYLYKSIFNINVLDLRDISAMKIDAIATRGMKRDFIDLYFICQRGTSLKKALSFYGRKYGKLSSNIVHIHKSLVYFVDAEIGSMPRMLKPCKWQEVKSFFEEEVKQLTAKLIN